MTSSLCEDAAPGRIIAPWMVKTAEFFGIMIKIILSLVENAGDTSHESGIRCRLVGAASPDMALLVPPGLDAAARCVRLADVQTRGTGGSPRQQGPIAMPSVRSADAGKGLIFRTVRRLTGEE
jgi:hypothetical protein